MAKQAKFLTSGDIIKMLQSGASVPVYYLHGEEAYYIDQVANWAESHLLKPEEQGFNQTVIYATPDRKTADICNEARRYPMMAERTVIIVKEAQNLRDLDRLGDYLKKPMPSTVLIFCHKHKKIDARKKIFSEIKKAGGVLFESESVKPHLLGPVITNFCTLRQVTIDAKASQMLADHVGADLTRLSNEIDKLVTSLGPKQKKITAELVEQIVGISKTYNTFELQRALVQKDAVMAMRIVLFYEQNPKTLVLPLLLGTLFEFFSNLMIAYYAPHRDERGVAQFIGLRADWLARDYVAAMRVYSGTKTMQIISMIRTTDARSKGIGAANQTDGALLRDLVMMILN